MSFAHAVRDEALSECEIVRRDNSFDQSPALWDGVPALPPFPMKCTVASELRASSTIRQNSSIFETGSFLMVSTSEEVYDWANSVKSKLIFLNVREGASYLRVDESKRAWRTR